MKLNIPEKYKAKLIKSRCISFRVTLAELEIWQEILAENKISNTNLFRLMLRDTINKYGGNDYDSNYLDELINRENVDKKHLLEK